MEQSIEDKPRVKRFSAIPSIDEWLSHSVVVPMASTPDDFALDDAGSSIGDSAYDFLDDRSAATTDDEGSANLTLSFSSSDRGESETPVIEQSQASALVRGPEDDGEDTTEDNQGSHVLQGGEWGIKFQEPELVNNNGNDYVEVSHILRVLGNLEVDDYMRKTSIDNFSRQTNLVLRQGMANHTLKPDRPFRLLFVGDFKAKDVIMQKLGSALAASSESSCPASISSLSRFSVVPISSFGETRSQSPEVMLVDSVGLEMSVEDCSDACFLGKGDVMDPVCLRLSNGKIIRSAWSSSESRFAITCSSGDWEVPDLAVFYLSETDSKATKSTHRFTRSFMCRHKISCLCISQTQSPSDQAESFVIDTMTPHLCLEPDSLGQERRQIVKRLPIDLSTFLELDARQLNKNLACFASIRRAQNASNQKIVTQERKVEAARFAANGEYGEKATTFSTTWSTLKHEAYVRWSEQRLSVITTVVLLSLLLALPDLLSLHTGQKTLGTSTGYNVCTDSMGPEAGTPNSKEASPRIIDSARSRLTTALATSTTSALMQIPTPKLQPVVDSNTDLAAFLLDSHALTPNNSAKFKVHVVGDRHVVLRPPRWFMRYRKAPKLYFDIMRQNEAVDYELLMLFDGVYALKLPQEEAYGTVNITVRTTSKPRINESFQVEFPATWLGSAGWKKAANTVVKTVRSDLDRVHKGMSVLYSRTDSKLQSFAHDTIKTVYTVGKDIERFRSASMNHTVRTTDLILARTKDLSRTFSNSLANGSLTLSKQLALYNDRACKDLILYVEHQKAAIKQGRRELSRFVPDMSSKRLANTVDSLRVNHLRTTQKMALKTWWKLVGSPRQGVPKPTNEKLAKKTHGSSKRKKRGTR